jgi:hypothetical protein
MTNPSLIARARALYQVGRFADAGALCRDIAGGAGADRAGDRAGALLLLAHVLRRCGDLAAARDVAVTALRESPDSTSASRVHVLMQSLVPSPDRRPVWALVPGVPRNLAECATVLNNAAALRREGLVDEILLSTWNGWISGNPAMARDLDRHRILWIENPEPSIRLPGHVLHQKKAFLAGLEACPADSNVLKLRTDKTPDAPAVWDGFRAALRGDLDLHVGAAAGYPAVFERRVAVNSFGNFANLFCINDISFFGRRGDLLKLAGMDARFAEVLRSVAPEQWYFAGPFIDPFPIFKAYFRIPFGATHSADLRRRLLATALADDGCLEMIASYLHVMAHYFRAGMRADRETACAGAAARLAALTCEELLLDDSHGLGCFYGHLGDDFWAPAFLDGRLRPSPLGERFRAALDKTRPYAFQQAVNPALISQEMEISGFHENMRALAAGEPGTWFNIDV